MPGKDEGSRRDHARGLLIDLSIEYYAAGRFLVLSRQHRVAPMLLHHAVEFVLKAALVRTRPLRELKAQFGHRLDMLWTAVTELNPPLGSASRALTVASLHPFMKLRYPDSLIKHGATVSIGIRPGENPVSISFSNAPRYTFNLGDVDELWTGVFASVANPPAFFQLLSPHMHEALTWENACAARLGLAGSH